MNQEWLTDADTCSSWQAPLSVPSCASLELVQQFFVKLGARYILILNADGYCACLYFCVGYSIIGDFSILDEGIIEKKRWVGFLGELEKKTGT